MAKKSDSSLARGKRPIGRDDILAILSAHRTQIAKFGVRSLALFGSFARGDARSDSDIDILVEFERPAGLFAFIRLQQYLENLLGRRVDLVTPDALKQRLREDILKEAVRAA